MTHQPTCTHCHRPMRPGAEKAADWPHTVARHNKTSCQSCYQRDGRPPKYKTWNARELFAEIDHIDAPPEETLRRLNVTAVAVAQAGYRHGRLDIARTFGRVAGRKRYARKQQVAA